MLLALIFKRKKHYNSSFAANPGCSVMCSVLIVYTSEAQDWASYLKLILEASHRFPQDSISFYLLDGEHSVYDEDYSIFSTSQSILLLLTVAFIDIQSEPGVRNTLKKFLYPPSKIVAFLCGVSDCDDVMDCFEHWNNWRKLDSDDEPALYVSTICDAIEEGMYFFIKKKNLAYFLGVEGHSGSTLFPQAGFGFLS